MHDGLKDWKPWIKHRSDHMQHEYRIAAWKQRYSRWKESISRRTRKKSISWKTEVQEHYGGCLYGIRRTEV